jgi:N-acetylmuramic acid 6-phosphate etherase
MVDTETVNPRFAEIDTWPTSEAVDAMLEGQLSAIASLRSQVSALATASDAAAERLRESGRLIYVGAGTSGRIAVQDGVELTPTYGWPEERLVFLMAGGPQALMVSVEGAEDDADDAEAQLRRRGVSPQDVVIGVAASGRTPFTVAAIALARNLGALTIGLANNAGSPLLSAADHPILADTGSEAVAGSTRMKAGTAQKAALNILSTAIMMRLGRVHQGLMVDMVISNAKLLDRAQRMVAAIAACEPATAAAAVEVANRNIKKAVLVAKGVSVEDAGPMLDRHQGLLRSALAALKPLLR